MSVYFAESCGYIKIGYSADPIARSTTITRLGVRPDDVPFKAPAHLIGWVPGDVRREQSVQAQFIECRAEGEWFRLDGWAVRDLIWADPRGVDMQRMSALAVFAMDRDRELTRDDVAAAGIPVMAVGVDELFARMNRRMAYIVGKAAS